VTLLARAAGARLALCAALLAGCATTRIVPVAAPGVLVDAARATASVAAEGVLLVVEPSAWRGQPWDLEHYVAPFLVSLTNGASGPVHYDYPSFRIFDDARFQYTALPPFEVERILRWRADEGPDRLAAIGSPPPVLRRRVVPSPYWDSSWGDRYEWYGWPWYGRPPVGDIYLRALGMGPLGPGARVEGFVYFPRPRAATRGLRLEFHHQVDGVPRLLTVSFEVEVDRDATRATP
jgi:hypothetical protein